MSWRQSNSQRSYKGYGSSSSKTTTSSNILPRSRSKSSRSSGSRVLVELSDNEDVPSSPAKPKDKGKGRDSTGHVNIPAATPSTPSKSRPSQRIQADSTLTIPLPPSPPSSRIPSIFGEDEGEVLRDLQLQSEFKLHYKVPSSRLIDRGLGESSRKRDAQRAQLANAEAFKRAREDGTLDITNGQGPATNAVSIEYHAMPDLGPMPELTAQQQAILDRIIAGESMFFTGSAGSGKSVLLRAIIKAFKDRYEAQRTAVKQGLEPPVTGKVMRWKLAVTASTGMAALNIGGRTLHSWSGVGTGVSSLADLKTRIMRSKPLVSNWETTHALIIDEISMIDGKLLDKLDGLGRAIRKNQRPFGGIQVIFTGDFHQLPPVTDWNKPTTFAFDSKVWGQAVPERSLARLTQIFRQRDMDFVILLEELRKGRVSMISERQLKSLSRVLRYDDGIDPTELYPSKREVNEVNDRELGRLATEEKVFTSTDTAGVTASGYPIDHAEAVRKLNKDTNWPEEISLKVGAVVMLVTNIQDSYLVNGSVGKVVAFMTPAEATDNGVAVLGDGVHGTDSTDMTWPVIEFVPSKYAAGPIAKRVMITKMRVELLNGAAKVEAERVQGQTLERVKVDLAKVFAEGQSYVALSRAVDMDGLEVKNFSRTKVKVSQRVLDWSHKFEGFIGA